MPYNFGKGSGTKGKGKMHKGLGFQPERGEQRKFGGYCNLCWQFGHKEAQCWFKHQYLKYNPPQDPLQRDIREWSNMSEKGQGHSQPKGNGKGEGKGKRKHPGKGNHNQDQAGSPNEENGQRTLGDFGLKRQRVEFVGDVQDNDDFETPRFVRAAYVFCKQKRNSVAMDSTELPSSPKRVSDGSEEPAGTHEKFDQSTGEVLFAVECRDDRPIVDSGSVVVPTEKVQHSMILEIVLGESLQHYCTKRNVPFINRTGSTMNVNFGVTDTTRAILSVHKGCGSGSMIVFTPDGKGKIVNDTKCIEQVKQIMEEHNRIRHCV